MAGLCKQCQWHILDDDFFCSWCGHELIGYKIEPATFLVFLDGKPGAQVRFMVENQGQTALRLHSIKADQPWIQVPDFARHAPLLLPNDPPFELVVDVDLSVPAKRVTEATITLAASDNKERQVTIVVTPCPEFAIEVSDCQVTLDASEDRPREGKLRLTTGYAQITKLQPKVPWVQISGAEECILDSRSTREVAFTMVIDKRMLREELLRQPEASRPRETRVLLEVIGPEGQEASSGQFAVSWSWPPTLQVRGLQRGLLQWSVFQGRRRTLTCSLANQGELALEITQIAPPGDTPWLYYGATLRSMEAPKWPVALAPQQAREFPFTVDGIQLPPGEYKTSLTVMSNSYPTGQVDVPVVVMVEQMPVYEGVVAIDFGTTNSCVAVFDRDGFESSVLQPVIDGQLEGHAVPSVILYERLEQETKDYRIGLYARAAGAYQRESVVQSIKYHSIN